MVYIVDAILADFVPGFLEKIMSNSLYMGLIMSCSSFAGIMMDLLFAQLLINTSVKRMMLIPIMGAFIFAVLLLAARAWPLVDAVYTDLLSRLRRKRKHMIGLNNSTMSLAYVVGPSIAGLLTHYVGEVRGIASWGLVVAVVCLILFFVTPKKLLLPQTEIRKWGL